MGWRRLALALIVLLPACAPINVPPPESTGEIFYLEARSSEYSSRFDQLKDIGALEHGHVLSEALVTSDGELHVAAAVFRRGDYFTLDLVVLNRGEEPHTLERGDLSIVDSAGYWMTSVDDYAGAAGYGLRAKASASVRDYPDYSMDDSGFLSAQALSLVAVEVQDPGPSKSRMAPARAVPRSSWYADPAVAKVSGRVPSAKRSGSPEAVEIPVGEGSTFWAYWKPGAPEVTYPVTAFVMLEGRHMIFQFDQQSGQRYDVAR